MPAYKFDRIGTATTTLTLNAAPTDGKTTVAIFGVPRGGTTMVAAVAEALGVYLGPRDELAAFHFEDQTMHSPYLDKVFECIQQRNAEHELWGWKDPVGVPSIQQAIFALRQPRAIVVFRDMLASIQGEMRFDKLNGINRSFDQLAEQTQNWWKQNLDFVRRSKIPTLLVSYERAMASPEMFVDELADFIGVTPTDQQRDEAMSRISHDGYLVLPKQITLAITAYNEHLRPGKLARALLVACEDSRIGEVVIVDDGSSKDGRTYIESLLGTLPPSRFKLALRLLDKNLGVFGAKLTAIRQASFDWVQSLDSDNAIDSAYLNTLYAQDWIPRRMFCAAAALPHFDYREMQGRRFGTDNIADLVRDWKHAPCMLNTGNQFFHRQTMVEAMADWPVENFQTKQQDYFHLGAAITDLKWRKIYDAQDSFWFNISWLRAGHEIYVVPDLTYQHDVHDGSSYVAAPVEKDRLSKIYCDGILDGSIWK